MTALQLFIAAYFAVLLFAFVVSSPSTRVILILLSLHTYGFHLFLGITLDTPGLLALASVALVCTGQVRRSKEGSAVIVALVPFFAWSTIVLAVGYFLLPSNLGHSWAQGSNGKPIVQAIAFAVDFFFIPVVVDGIRTRSDLRRIIRWWIIIALASALISFLQVLFHLFTGQQLWGVIGREGFAGTSVLGFTVQRANAFGGEPKQQAILMFYGIVVSAASFRMPLGLPEAVKRLAPWLMLIGLLVTFSSGGFLVLGLFIGYSILMRARHNSHLKRIAIGSICCVLGAIALFPDAMMDVYEQRVVRILGKVVNSRDLAIGAGRVEKLTDDKEIPAMAYLIRHPEVWATGVGIGCCPFYYEDLVERRSRGTYQEPNGGFTRWIYSFGMVGILLFVSALWPYARGAHVPDDMKGLSQNMAVATLLVFAPIGLNFWLTFTIGLLAGVRALESAATRRSLGTRLGKGYATSPPAFS